MELHIKTNKQRNNAEATVSIYYSEPFVVGEVRSINISVGASYRELRTFVHEFSEASLLRSIFQILVEDGFANNYKQLCNIVKNYNVTTWKWVKSATRNSFPITDYLLMLTHI